MIKHRDLEAALRMRRLGAEIDSSELLTLMLETRGGGQGQILDTVHHLGHLIFVIVFGLIFCESFFLSPDTASAPRPGSPRLTSAALPGLREADDS